MNRLPMRTSLLAALFLLASLASYAAPERFTTIRVNIQEEKIELFLRFGTDRRSRSVTGATVSAQLLLRRGHDPQALFRRISTLFEEGQSENRSAAQSRHIQLARGCREARARGAVLQASRLMMARRKQEENRTLTPIQRQAA